jgi:hydroxymethylpyrimidine pyrophosphatase-like HAD family hydrolase
MPVVSLNGALIKDASGNLMHASAIRPEWSHELLMVAEQYKELSVSVFTHQGVYSEVFPLNLPRYLNSCPEEHRHVKSVMPHLDDAVLLVFSGPIKTIQGISMASVQKFKGHMSRVVYQSRSGSGHYYMELRNAAPNKGYALRVVSHALGISRNEVAAIGDFMNDEEMLRWAGIAVAMRNASDDLKRLSDMVTLKTNDEDGVAEFLDFLYASRQ